MDSALGWIGQIIEWIGKFFPRWAVITPTDGAMKSIGFFFPYRTRSRVARWFRTTAFEGDMKIVICGPGLHWYWPATTQWGEWPTATQTDDLKAQTIETEDGFSVSVGGQITYNIADLSLAAPKLHSTMKFIQTTTLAAIHQICCKFKWSDLKAAQRKGTLNTQLRNAVKKELSIYGIDVEEVRLTDLSSTFVLRIMQSTQQDDLI